MRLATALPLVFALACTSDAAMDAASPPDAAADVEPDARDGAVSSEVTDAADEALALREALGIPPEAERVLVFGQTAHLDIDWQLTFDAYYRGFVDDIFTQALDALAADPDYRYAVCEMGYLRRYWEEHPERQEAMRGFAREGRLAVVGGGVSSPDVLLPLGDNLLRDFRSGLSWLRSVDLPRTSAAWLPDDFGLGPTTPDLLAGLGYSAVAFWRVDGSSETPTFNASVADFAHLSTVSGSGAEALSGAIDFLWDGTGGARVFAHWLSHSYLFGDYVDFASIEYRVLGQPLGTPADRDGILDNIATMAGLVLPVSPTDYGFIPVGGDFQYPKKDLAAWCRAWNEERYATTGVWAVAATFDDFARLAMSQADRLTARAMDFTPYWMGFYASREGLKEDARLGSAALSQAEALSVIAGDVAPIDRAEVERLSWIAGKTDHHDWITGTSPNATVRADQVPQTKDLRASSEALRDGLVRALAAEVPGEIVVVNTEGQARKGRVSLPWEGPGQAVKLVPLDQNLAFDGEVHEGVLEAEVQVPAFGYRAFAVTGSASPGPRVRCLEGTDEVPCGLGGERVEVVADVQTVTFDRRSGGTLAAWRVGERAVIGAPSARVLDYLDDGGLYTFAHETATACAFAPHAEITPSGAVSVSVLSAGVLGVTVAFTWEDNGITWQRSWRIAAERPAIDLDLTVGAASGHTLLARFDLAGASQTWMSVPGGVIQRPPKKRIDPTFWPFERWAASRRADGVGIGLVAPANPGISFTDEGALDLVLVRRDGSACADPHAADGEREPVRLSLRLFALAPGDDLVATMDREAAEVYAPLLAARASDGPGTLPAVDSLLAIDGPARIAHVARAADGVTLTLERRLADPTPAEVILSSSPAFGDGVSRSSADGGPSAPLSVDPRGFTLELDRTYDTLRFTASRTR